VCLIAHDGLSNNVRYKFLSVQTSNKTAEKLSKENFYRKVTGQAISKKV
jgi:hypothetical protein